MERSTFTVDRRGLSKPRGNVIMPEAISDQCRQEYDQLLDMLVPHAQNMIRKYRDLVPVGAAVDADGKVELVAGWTGEDMGSTEDVERLLVSGMRQSVKAGKYRSTGIALQMREIRRLGAKPMPAIKIILESKFGPPAFFYVPYERKWLRRIVFGDPLFVSGESLVFDDSKDVS